MSTHKNSTGVFLLTLMISLLRASSTLGIETNQATLTIDLPTVLRLAGARHLEIQIAQEKLAQAKAENQGSIWKFFPSVNPGVGYRRHDDLIQDVQGRVIDVHKDSYAVGPVVEAQVELGEAIYNHLASRQREKAAIFALESQRQDAMLSAAQGYFDLAKARSALSVAGDAVRIAQEYAEQIRRAVDTGIAFQGDALRAQVQMERNQLALRQAEESRWIASSRLVQILHLDPGVTLTTGDGALLPLELMATNTVLGTVLEQAFNSRPELTQSRFLVAAANASKNEAQFGPLIPNLSASVFLGGLGGGNATTSRGLGASEDYAVALGWRIGPGGLFDRSRIRTATARMKIAQLQSEQLGDEIARQVMESFGRWQSMKDQMEMNRRAVIAAEGTLRLTQQRKEFAVGAVLETIQAEQEWTRIRLDFLNTVAEFNKAQYALQKAIGGFSPSVPLPPAVSP